MSATATRLLDNYIAGRWTPAEAATEVLDVTNPATGETLARVPLSGAADLDAAVTRRPRGAARVARGVDDRPRAQAVRAARAAGGAPARSWRRSVTTEMGKTIADARAEVARMIEMVEAACAIPTTMQGRILEDVVAQHRRRDDPPAGRGVRGDRARSTSRRWCRSGSCRSRSRAATRSCSSPPSRCRSRSRSRSRSSTRWGCRRAWSTSSTAAARSWRGSSITPGSTRSRSSGRRRWPGSSTSARRRPASACRRWAAPRTTWS